MKIGLFFGSYNPIHIGHLIIGNYVAEEVALDQVWFIVSPQSPFKDPAKLINGAHRYQMAALATASNDRLLASNVEFDLPTPSYTIDTLTHLKEKYPGYRFSLIMGSDNLTSLDQWKEHEAIIENHQIIVYRRPGVEGTMVIDPQQISFLENTPLLHISSTFLRKQIKKGKSITYLVPESVEKYIHELGLFK